MMDEKVFACLSRGLLILFEGVCEKHCVRASDPHTYLADENEVCEGNVEAAQREPA